MMTIASANRQETTQMDAQIQVDVESPTVLCVGDEKEMLSALDRLFEPEEFRFLAVSDPMEAIRLLRQHDVQLVISSQRLPGGGENLFLKRVAAEFPGTLRSVLISSAEADLAGRLVQQGYIDKFFLRPWNDEKLKWEIRHTLAQHALIQENQRLLKSVQDQDAVIRHLEKRLIESAGPRNRLDEEAGLSRMVLDQLPLPVIGISGGIDGSQKIILANRAARRLPMESDPLEPGRRVCEFFPDAISGRLTVALHTGTIRVLNRRSLWGGVYDLTCIPLEAGCGTGVLLLHRIK
ncbi:MAG: response regulator [Thermodesulfobacteriota bacterium]